MKHFDPKSPIRPTPKAKGYLDVLKKNGAFSRMVDAYTFAAAYAIKNNVEVQEVSSRGRQEMVLVDSVDEDIRLAIEAGIHIIRKRRGLPEPVDSREVMEVFIQYAEAGLEILKRKWDGKVGIQIQDDIRKIISS